MMYNNDNLEEITIIDDFPVSAATIKNTLTTCKNLNTVRLNSGNQFTDDEMLAIFTNTPGKLKELTILYNRSITQINAQAILTTNPHLPKIYIINEKQKVLAQRPL